MHYDRWVHATPKADRGPAPRNQRNFWDHVDKSGDCWLWTGPQNRKGYGLWSVPGFRGLAHRYSLMLVESPKNNSLFACHHCDNPPCVNPQHLYWGDALDNARDVVARQGVHNKGVYSELCSKGHPMSGENLRIYGKDDQRFCRACGNDRAREYQRRKREASNGNR